MPGEYNINAYKGDTLILTLTLEGPNGVPLILPATGWKADIRVRADLITVVTSFEVDSSDAANGKIKLTLPASASAIFNHCVYDLQLIENGAVTTYIYGTIDMQQDVTR